MADKLLERLQRCSTRTSWPCRLAPERPPGLARRAFASGSAFGCFRHGCKLQPCLQRAAARRAGALLPSAACTLRTWEASPECMLIASRSVGERPTPQASRCRQERGARTSPRTASCRRLYDLPRCQSDFHFRNHIFSGTKPHLFSYGPVSLRAAAAWVGRLGRRLAPRALLVFQPPAHQHERLNASLPRTCCVSKYQ